MLYKFTILLLGEFSLMLHVPHSEHLRYEKISKFIKILLMLS